MGRCHFLGSGGLSNTHIICKASSFACSLCPGVTITPIDDLQFEVFAPNQTAMDEAREIINQNLQSKVNIH